jgi:hypothetical protein
MIALANHGRFDGNRFTLRALQYDPGGLAIFVFNANYRGLDHTHHTFSLDGATNRLWIST